MRSGARWGARVRECGRRGGGVQGGVPPILLRCTAVLIHHLTSPHSLLMLVEVGVGLAVSAQEAVSVGVFVGMAVQLLLQITVRRPV